MALDLGHNCHFHGDLHMVGHGRSIEALKLGLNVIKSLTWGFSFQILGEGMDLLLPEAQLLNAHTFLQRTLLLEGPRDGLHQNFTIVKALLGSMT